MFAAFTILIVLAITAFVFWPRIKSFFATYP